MSKKKFEYMSTNEWLGDMTTHFMKSGESLRSPANEQSHIASLIPRMANGVKVEYDIAYDIPNKIHGYKYSDFLTKALYICPQSFRIATENIKEIAQRAPTKEGIRINELLKENIEDKYIQLGDESFKPKELVVLPGTNLLTKDDIIDMDKVDILVAGGAYVKLHPITERTWVNFLKQRWGKKVIDGDVPLYPLLRNCEKVWFPMSSETGMAAVLFGKAIGNINSPNKKNPSNFEHIYQGISRAKNGSLLNKMAALWSYPESGMITTYHEDPTANILGFFVHMGNTYPHK